MPVTVRSIGHLKDGRKSYVIRNGKEYMAVTDLPAVTDIDLDYRECAIELTLPDEHDELTTASPVLCYMVTFELTVRTADVIFIASVKHNGQTVLTLPLTHRKSNPCQRILSRLLDH